MRTLSTRWHFDWSHAVHVLQVSLDETFTGITAYNASRRYHYFRMGKNFELKIPKAAWTYFGGPPRQLLNRSVIARGWINQGKYRLQMQVAHPDMLELKP